MSPTLCQRPAGADRPKRGCRAGIVPTRPHRQLAHRHRSDTRVAVPVTLGALGRS